MKPNIELALSILEPALEHGAGLQMRSSELFIMISEATGALRGYELFESVRATYVCSHCSASGVKLWRSIGDGNEKWCSACACKQAGLPDTIDTDGRIEGEHGASDQIYNPEKGLNLLPCVPCIDEGTWGYTSVPPEGVLWWRTLPTRLP